MQSRLGFASAPHIPAFANAVMDVLRFQSPDCSALGKLDDSGWRDALDFCDRTMLTLPLGLACRALMPDWAAVRIDRNLCNNAERWTRIQSVYREASEAFQEEGLECVVLKGFSHCPDFICNPRHRPQFDIDLLFPRDRVVRARDAAARLGYEPMSGYERNPLNHLPAMVRKTGWEWDDASDAFDPDIPIALELHFQLWDARAERFGPDGLEEFWERRESRVLDGLDFEGLHPADQAANAALHLLRHLLRGSLRPSHVHEVAALLHRKAEDDGFWDDWRRLHSASLRRLEVLCFEIAARWFDCKLSPAVQATAEDLPEDVRRWIDWHALAPLESVFHPNKDELWLHWSLLDSPRARLHAVRRKILPQRLPSAVSGVYIPAGQATFEVRIRNARRYAAFVLSRLRHHLAALPQTAWSAARWFAGGLGLGAQYWRFFLAEGLFDFGMFIFVFVYNLYLLQIGFREDFLGWMTGLMAAGNVAGSLLAVYALQRFGTRRTLLGCFALTSALNALRAVVPSPPALLGLAAATGLASSVWPVAFAPAVTRLTTSKNRAVGFSFICSSGIAIGVLGGLIAGGLPGWLQAVHAAGAGAASYRGSLLAASAIIALALVPLSGVRFGPAPPPQPLLARPSKMVVRFLIAMAAWNLGTGVMNPFFNVYFARSIHLPVQQIGYVFSFAQVAQVAAVLAAPLVLRRFGLTRGISGMQFATAATLLALAAAAGPVWAALGYTAYMMAQYMSEPGTFTLLMEGATAAERTRASALNFLVSFSGQAAAAAIAGMMLSRFGYPPVFAAAAVICTLAALLFRVLLSTRQPLPPSDR